MPNLINTLDHDRQTMTIAVTFKWQEPWAMGGCEAAELVGDLFRLLAEHYADDRWEHLAGIESVSTWDPDEERACYYAHQAPCRFDRGASEPPHTGHFSHLGGTYWCDTCNSPYCDLA